MRNEDVGLGAGAGIGMRMFDKAYIKLFCLLLMGSCRFLDMHMDEL